MAAVVSRRARRRRSLIAFALGVALATPSLAEAQDNSAAPAPPAATQAAPAVPAAGGEQAPRAQNLFTRAELEKLLAPIALYPDALLAQLLAASAYPIQIVEAQRWLDGNKAAVAKNDFSWIDSRNSGPGGEGAGALSHRDQDHERRSRQDDGFRRRRGEPAPGRRRRHSGAARQGGKGGLPEDDAAADGLEHLCRQSLLHHDRTC